jgi:hypothetical protein
MWRALLIGPSIVAIGVATGCGDNLAATIEIDAPGARWMAVRASPDAAWERYDGDVVRFEARGAFDVAVVCRDDVGDGFTIRATPDDGLVYDDILCGRRGTITPQFAVTGRADVIFVGYSANYVPNVAGEPIAPGTYDVIAEQLSTDFQQTERVQVLRDVVVDGVTPIAIDVDQLGVPPADATVTVDGGATPDFVDVTGETGNGTWFRFFGRSLHVMPPDHARAGDREVAQVYDGEEWANVVVHAGANDVRLPHDTLDATFSHVEPATVTWRSSTSWDTVTFRVDAWTTIGPHLPRWRIIAQPGAFRDTGDGRFAVELPVPDLADWKASWMTDLAAPHFMYASWDRARLDGGHGGVYKSEQR